MTEHWKIGNRLYDDDYEKFGVVYDIDDYGEFVVLYVRWDDGSVSDFTPDESTKRVER